MNPVDFIKKEYKLYVSGGGYGRRNFYRLLIDEEFSKPIYDTLSEWISDPLVTPERIVDLIDTQLRSIYDIDDNQMIAFQRLVSFSCLGGLMKRRPILDESWYNLFNVIVKYSSYISYEQMKFKGLSHFIAVKNNIFKWIVKSSSPIICPDPYIRLVLFILNYHYRSGNEGSYDKESFCEIIVNTVIEFQSKFPSFTINQVAIVPWDFWNIMRYHLININFIMKQDQSSSKKMEIIAVFLKITRNFAHLEKKRIPLSSKKDEGLLVCLTFCGLIPEHNQGFAIVSGIEIYMPYFIKIILNNHVLLDYAIDIFKAIDISSTKLGKAYNSKGEPCNLVIRTRDIVCSMFNKAYTDMTPMLQYTREINGGLKPAVQYQIRFYSKYAIIPSQDEDCSPEGEDSEESDLEGHESEDIDLETDDDFEEDNSDNSGWDENDSFLAGSEDIENDVSENSETEDVDNESIIYSEYSDIEIGSGSESESDFNSSDN